MAKKLTLLGMAIAALAAFAIPAVASASPELTDSSGKLAAGAQVIGTSSNAVTTNTGLGTLSCKTVTINAEVTENSGTSIKAAGKSGATTTCNAAGKELTVTKPTLVSLSTSGGDAGTLSLTFIADVGPLACHYAGTGAFTYATGSNVLNIAGITLASTSSELCEPEEGSPKFEGNFSLTTSGGDAVKVN